MVPPAISVIYCHLRWQDGSLWHWPLTDPTFSGGQRIELGVTPLSDIRIYLRGCAGKLNNSWILAAACILEKREDVMMLHRILSPPRGRWIFCSDLQSLDLPLCVFLFSASLRFIPHLETKTDTTCGSDDLSCVKSAAFLVQGLVELFRAWSIWLYRPKL